MAPGSLDTCNTTCNGSAASITLTSSAEHFALFFFFRLSDVRNNHIPTRCHKITDHMVTDHWSDLRYPLWETSSVGQFRGGGGKEGVFRNLHHLKWQWTITIIILWTIFLILFLPFLCWLEKVKHNLLPDPSSEHFSSGLVSWICLV